MREALQAMIADGTAALAWEFDPAAQLVSVDELDRSEAQIARRRLRRAPRAGRSPA